MKSGKPTRKATAATVTSAPDRHPSLAATPDAHRHQKRQEGSRHYFVVATRLPANLTERISAIHACALSCAKTTTPDDGALPGGHADVT
jgi:hypothetical protein